MKSILILVLGVLIGLFISLIRDRLKIFTPSDPMHYPVFTRAEITAAANHLKKLRERHYELYKVVQANTELEKGKPFAPTEELKNVMRDFLASKKYLERSENTYNYMIEGNASVISGAMKIREVRAEWYNVKDRGFISESVLVGRELDEWVDSLSKAD